MATTTNVKESATPSPAYRAPTGAERDLTLRAHGRVHAVCDWISVREHGVPTAEVFFTSYSKKTADRRRPIMFLFNGGPGAASAFLHVGTAGPMRLEFGKSGHTLPPPATLVENRESWLTHADLVFVDPVGTGLSRTAQESRLEQQSLEADDEKREKRTKDLPDVKKGFFKIKRDIDVLCEFVSAYLSRFGRWESPVLIAGESYGGFRVGKLLRALPERGVSLSGAIMISPAIDFLGVAGSDYDSLAWIGAVPVMAMAAAHHGRCRGRFASMRADAVRSHAEEIATEELAPLLLLGDRAKPVVTKRVLSTISDLVGLPPELVERSGGRVRIDVFARELLRDRGLVCGLYDAAMTGPNVFPDREGESNPDPSLSGAMGAYTAAINSLLRARIGLRTSREYHLMSDEVWKSWTDDRAAGYWQRQLECADDMRYGLAMNPHLRLLIAHGNFDLVTTYYSSQQSVAALRLPEVLRRNVELTTYDGGHMFYTWESSRKAIWKHIGRLMSGHRIAE